MCRKHREKECGTHARTRRSTHTASGLGTRGRMCVSPSTAARVRPQKLDAETAAIRNKDTHGATKESAQWLNALARRFFVEYYDSMRSFLTLKIKEEVIDVKRHAVGWIIVRPHARPGPGPAHAPGLTGRPRHALRRVAPVLHAL